MNRIRISLAFAIFAIFADVAAVRAATTQIYDVDPAYRQEVYQILRGMLGSNDASIGGNVHLLPTGQIVVDTFDEARQEQVAAVLAAIQNSAPDRTPTLTLRYWVLQGTPGATDATVPAVLSDAVRELETVHGELGIRVLDAVIVSGRAGRQASFANEHLEIVHVAHASEESLNATIDFASEVQELSVDVSMTPGEFVVLSSGTSQDVVTAVIVNWPGSD
jgi:hypothetical protein